MASGSFIRRPAVLLAFALCSVGGVVTLLGRLATGPKIELKRVPLSNEAGTKSYAAFSPDGQRLAYSARGTGKSDVFHLFVRTVAPDTPRQLTQGSGSDVGPAWSPDGTKIAFQRTTEESVQYVVVPVDGGEERKVVESPATGDEAQALGSVAWSKDGNSLVVVQRGEKQAAGLAVVEVASGKVNRITNPPEGAQGDASPAMSPDGATLAFVRYESDGADIYTTDLGGNHPRRLTYDNEQIRGIAWTPDGQDLVYSATRAGGWTLWRLPAFGGSARAISIAGRRAQFPAVSATGNHLIFADSPSVSSIWRGTLDSVESPSEEKPLLRSAGNEYSAMYSPDGKKIADFSDQTGADEVWVSDADGSNRVQVTSFKGPPMLRLRWAPDSKSVVFDVRGEHSQDLYTVAVTAGAKPERVAQGAWNASWSHDGKRIYFDARGQIWKADADGKNPKVLTEEFGPAQAVESADGKYVFYRFRRSLYRVSVAGGEAEEVINPDHDLLFSTTIQPTKNGVYYAEFQRSSRMQLVAFYDFAGKKNTTVYQVKGNMGFGQGHVFSVSPDGKYVIYPRVDQSQTDLVLLENFK